MSGYTPRHIEPLPLWQIGSVRFKPHVIRAAIRGRDAARAAEAQAFLASAPPPEGVDLDSVGFVILHLGEDADWLLADWWVNGDSIAQRLYAGRPDGGPFQPVAVPLVACVWELAVIGHERTAFVRSCMADGGGAEAYLSDSMEAGFY